MSVAYRDAWEVMHPDEPGHTFTPANPLVTARISEWQPTSVGSVPGLLFFGSALAVVLLGLILLVLIVFRRFLGTAAWGSVVEGR